MQNKKYQIRCALGKYWILDMDMDGLNYRSPLSLNESGKYIWDRLEAGKKPELIAEDLNRDFGVDLEEARSDIDYFCRSLTEQGITIYPCKEE